ncbi:MAG TPA: hypothetical protein VF883_00485 [Thermoanaerobaculia bacterium]|jgi:hypothetical protein
MRVPRLFMLLAGSFAAAAASAQSLSCPAPPAGRTCDAFHYHVQMYRPDTRVLTEFYGGTQFANEEACKRAREQQVAQNAKVVEFMRANKDQKYEPDRVGACHCDMTTERSSVTYLDEAKRIVQLRTAEEIRLRVRERLLDRKAPTDSEVVRDLWADLPSTPSLEVPKLVPLPTTPRAPIATSADDLRPTRTLDTAKPSVAALDLPLVDIGATPASPPAEQQPALKASEGTSPPALAQPVVEQVAEPVIEERVEAQPEPITESVPALEMQTADSEEDSPELTAERFISYETQRIQSVLRASSAIGDENVKTKIFEASMERIQLLSNLRLLIEGSGVRSRLAAAARDAQTEEQRLALVSQLFGSGMQPHWAPKDAADVVFTVDNTIAAEPERVLRDTTGRFTPEQKKRALYLVLARTQPTEEQRLWLTTVVEGFLR